jgi:hypothetical protein
MQLDHTVVQSRLLLSSLSTKTPRLTRCCIRHRAAQGSFGFWIYFPIVAGSSSLSTEVSLQAISTPLLIQPYLEIIANRFPFQFLYMRPYKCIRTVHFFPWAHFRKLQRQRQPKIDQRYPTLTIIRDHNVRGLYIQMKPSFLL